MPLDYLIPVLNYVGDIRYYGALATRLTRRGARVGLLAFSRDGETALRAEGHQHVFYAYEGLDPQRPLDLDEVARIERDYSVDSLADHVFPERQYWGGTFEENAVRAVHIFRTVERLAAEHRVAMFVNNLGGEMVRRTMQRISDTRGTPKNVVIDFAPFHGRSTFTTRETAWDELPEVPPPLAPDEREFIAGLLTEATREKKMFTGKASLGINAGSFYRPLVRIARALSSREQQEENLRFVYGERLRNVARRAVNPRFYQLPVEGEPYLFFPLHVPNDMAITIRAPQFQRQQDVLTYLAERCLPTGTRLYIKPHPAGVDTYPIPMMTALSRLPNVRLIDPTVNSHRLIAGARGVVVINSTVGCEALMYGKPVVVMARVFYRGFGITTDCDYLGDLRPTVRRALEGPPDREAIYRFFHACWKASRPGLFGRPDDQNLDHITDGLVAKAERLGLGWS